MLALKSFRTAAVTLAGVELAHRIRKRQFSFGRRSPRRPCSLKQLWACALISQQAEPDKSRALALAPNRQCTRTQVLIC
jgi:hypothetical protein